MRVCLCCSYYQTVPDEASDPELLKLGTDKSLFDDEGFLPFAQKYKESQETFFEDYKKVGYVRCLSFGGFEHIFVALCRPGVACSLILWRYLVTARVRFPREVFVARRTCR